MTHVCISKLSIIGSDNGLSQNHYLNQCWNIVNWTLENKPQWNLYRNSYIFIKENAFENVIWKMAAILSQPQCGDHTKLNFWSSFFLRNTVFMLVINAVPVISLCWLSAFVELPVSYVVVGPLSGLSGSGSIKWDRAVVRPCGGRFFFIIQLSAVIIIYNWWQEQRQNINQMLDPPKTPHSSP